MPSRWTFQIPPVAEFIRKHWDKSLVSVDPFCGTSDLATHRHDMSQTGTTAEEWLDSLIGSGVRADLVFFDPPYSPRQISECYKGIGRKCTGADTQNAALYSRVKQRLDAILSPGGVVLSFGWQSSGFGKKYETTEILLVQHGGAHNDTICVAQRKPITNGVNE
jgi:hypothetical protein